MNSFIIWPDCIYCTVTVTKRTFVSVSKDLKKKKKKTLYSCPKEKNCHHTGCLSKTVSLFQLAPPMTQLQPVVGCMLPGPRHLLLNSKRGQSPILVFRVTSLILHSHVTHSSIDWVSWFPRLFRMKFDTDTWGQTKLPSGSWSWR